MKAENYYIFLLSRDKKTTVCTDAMVHLHAKQRMVSSPLLSTTNTTRVTPHYVEFSPRMFAKTQVGFQLFNIL